MLDPHVETPGAAPQHESVVATRGYQSDSLTPFEPLQTGSFTLPPAPVTERRGSIRFLAAGAGLGLVLVASGLAVVYLLVAVG